MSKSRDLASLASSATGLATDAELSAAVAGIDLTNVQKIVPVDSNISVPGAPTSVSATVANASSAVSFVAPTDNGGSTILAYTVISSPGNIKKSGTTSPITITGLTNGTAYTFTVKAHNIAGSSVASSASSSVTPVSTIGVNYLVVAGGGGSGTRSHSGGGGAGGLRSTVTATGGNGSLESALNLVYNTNYTVTVGAGGTSGINDGENNTNNGASNGSNSIFSTITSTGGGYGGTYGTDGANGGSGGGSGPNNASGQTAGTGTANQGFGGGIGAFPQGSGCGGGGGGASAAGGNGNTNTNGGAGGAGVAVSITGSSVTYAGGGGGGGSGGGAGGTGGSGGGGTGANGTGSPSSGTANTGGGAGGGGGDSRTRPNGGSGVVILRYLTSVGTITIGAGLTGSTATDGSHKVTTITAGTGNVSWAQ